MLLLRKNQLILKVETWVRVGASLVVPTPSVEPSVRLRGRGWQAEAHGWVPVTVNSSRCAMRYTPSWTWAFLVRVPPLTRMGVWTVVPLWWCVVSSTSGDWA